MAAITSKTSFVVRLVRQNVAPAFGAACTSRRQGSTASRDQLTNLAAHKRGTGGRSSFSGVVATVLGASGFMGTHVVNKLAKIGTQVIVPYRADPYHVKDLKLAGDLGQVLFLPYNLRDEESIRKCMQYSDVVVNLVGREWDTKNFSLEAVNTEGAQRIARIAREMGVKKMIHFSHLNAQPDPPSIYVKGGSRYLKSKFHGEERIREEFPDATIFRPADIYGTEDRFLSYYANAWRRTRGKVPLWKKGTQTVKMPVFCSDVAEGVLSAIRDPEAVGRVYECVGPHKYYLSDLVDYFYSCMRWSHMKRTYVTPEFRFKVWLHSYAPSTPILHLDKLDREHVSDKLSGVATLEDLGIKLTRLEDRAPFELKPYQLFRYYEAALGEFPDPSPPPVVA